MQLERSVRAADEALAKAQGAEEALDVSSPWQRSQPQVHAITQLLEPLPFYAALPPATLREVAQQVTLRVLHDDYALPCCSGDESFFYTVLVGEVKAYHGIYGMGPEEDADEVENGDTQGGSRQDAAGSAAEAGGGGAADELQEEEEDGAGMQQQVLVTVAAGSCFYGQRFSRLEHNFPELDAAPVVKAAAATDGTVACVIALPGQFFEAAVKSRWLAQRQDFMDQCCRMPFLQHMPLRQLALLSRHLRSCTFEPGQVTVPAHSRCRRHLGGGGA